jgi:hypothetical protein
MQELAPWRNEAPSVGGNLVFICRVTFAQPSPDPDLDWSEVGPLSARTTNYVRASVSDQDAPTLGEVLSNIADYKETGEISPKGSISWSDFDAMKKATTELKLRD